MARPSCSNSWFGISREPFGTLRSVRAHFFRFSHSFNRAQRIFLVELPFYLKKKNECFKLGNMGSLGFLHPDDGYKRSAVFYQSFYSRTWLFSEGVLGSAPVACEHAWLSSCQSSFSFIFISPAFIITEPRACSQATAPYESETDETLGTRGSGT